MLFHTVKHHLLNDNTQKINIIPIADTHIGDPNFNENKLNETLYEIKHTESLTILLGDLINNGIKSSISNCYEETMRPSDQIRYLVKLLTPIKSKIIGAIEGNHERRTTKEVDQSPCERYCERLGIQYFGSEVFLKLQFGKCCAEGNPINYGIYGYHGHGGGRLPGGKINNLARMSNIVIADVYLMGHTHTMDVLPQIVFVPDFGHCKINQQEMMCVMTGAYLDRGGYAAEKAYHPTKLGSPIITLDGKKKSVKVTL